MAIANPQGGVVSGGQASIVTASTSVDILQQSNRAVIDWRGFDIAPNERTEFHQPSADAIALNRVHSTTASTINGTLKANGNVIIVNQNGVLFGKQAVVDVNGLVATTADADNNQFLNGTKTSFDKPGDANAAIVNEGTITAKDSGLVGFVAPQVENHGMITARLGRVQLAGGDKATVDFYGDGLMEVAVSDEVTRQLVKNTGSISADGGKIALTAAAGRQVLASSIEAGGTLRAQTVQQRDGVITISALGSNAVAGNVAANKGKSLTTSTVVVNGTVDASGKNSGQKGGAIIVTGDKIRLERGAKLSASGSSGGGSIKIGGDYQGKGPTPAAKELLVLPSATIDNNAIDSGNGGRTILWSDGATYFDGFISNRGGALSGNGGFVEVSGHEFLGFTGLVDTRAPRGRTGTLLLDPADVTISTSLDSNNTGNPNFMPTAAAATSNINVTTLQNALNTSNVNITSASTGAGFGDITFANAVNWNSANSLTVNATRHIVVNAPITNAGTGSITLNANIAAAADVTINNNITTNGSITVLATRDVTLGAGRTLTTGATGSISLRAANAVTTNTGNLNLLGNISVGTGGLTLVSGINGTRPNYTATVTNLVPNSTSFGAINITGFLDTTINRDLTSNSSISINSFRDLTLSAGRTISPTSVNGAITLTAANNVFAGVGNLNLLGTLNAGSGSLFLLSGANGTRPNYTITTTNLTQQAANFGQIDIRGFQDTTINRDLTSNSAITFVSNRDLTLGAANTLTTGAGSSLALQAANNNTNATGNLNLNGTISIGTGTVSLASGSNGPRPNYTLNTSNFIQQGAAFNSINIQGFQDITINRDLLSTGSITFVAFRDLTLNAANTLTTGPTSSFNLQAANGNVSGVGNLNLNGTLSIGTGNLTLRSGANGSRPNYTLGTSNFILQGATIGAIDVQGLNNITINRDLPSTSNITFLAFTDLTLNAGNTLTTGAANSLALQAANNQTSGVGNLNLNGTVRVGTGSVNLRSGANGTRPSYTFNTSNFVLLGANIGPLDARGWQDITINQNLPVGGSIVIIPNRDLFLNAGITLSGSSVNLQAAAGNFSGTGVLNLNGIISVGTGGLTLISGLNPTRANYTATTSNLVPSGGAFGTFNIQGFNNFTINRVLNLNNANIQFTNNVNTILQNNLTVTGSGNINIFNNPITIADGANVTISTTSGFNSVNVPITGVAGGGVETLTVTSTGSSVTVNTVNGVNFNASGTSFSASTLGGTSALGPTVITSATAFVLPSTTASSILATTTTAGQQIFTSGPLTATGNITLNSAGSIIRNTGNITTTGGVITLTATNAILLNANGAVFSSGGGAINFTAPNAITFAASSTVSSGGGNINFNGPVRIGAPVTLTLGGGTLNFSSTVNGNPNFASTFSVLAVGGGGGGGGGDSTAASGGSGGGGGVVDTVINTAPVGSTYTVTVAGGGGGGGSNTNNNGRGGGGNGSGATGGNAGTIGLSGGGGGGGGLSGLSIGGTFYAAGGGGAGGGGSNEGTANDVVAPGGGNQPNGNTGLIGGGSGAQIAGDGGGGGGGGGGFFGGNGQTNLLSGGQASGGANYFNPANVNGTLYVGNDGAIGILGTALGAAPVVIDPTRAAFYGYANNAGAGGNAPQNANGAGGGAGTVIIRYTGTASQAYASGNFTTSTVGGDTIITYNGGQNSSFVPIGGCSGGCNLTINSAATVNFGGAVGGITPLNAVAITTTGGAIFPAITASSLAITGTAYLNGDITTTPSGNVTFSSPVFLLRNTNISAGTGTVTFASTVDNLPAIPTTVQALVVAGGGGGGGGTGGGGGAGGVLFNAALTTVNGTNYAVTVGTGGTGGGNYNGASTLPGTNGTNSIFNGLTAIGGGGGGANNLVVGRAGGSGGGGAHDSNGGAGTAGQGNAGGTGINGSTNYGASGGGGAASAGIGGTTTQGGNGGAGVANSITGSSVIYGGGGGGGIYATASNFGLGGTGGGGNGGSSAGGGGNGTNGLGGGGGGAGNNNSTGGTGGNGVVIVRYTGSAANAIAPGGTATTVGGDTVWTFNSNGSFTPVSGTCASGCNLTVNGGSITASGTIGGTSALGALSLNSTTGLILPSITASNIFARSTGAASDISIAAGRVLRASDVGNAITLASGRNFINNAGAGAINLTGGGRYLIYSLQPSSDTTGGLVNNFRRFSCAYGGVGACAFNATVNNTVTIPAAGNGFIYSSTPGSLTLTISTIGNVTYGDSVNLTNIAVNPTTLGQYLNASDFAADVITGSIDGSTTYVPGAAGGGLGTYNINYLSGQLNSTIGYNISYANNPSAFTVVRRPITASLVAPITKVYDGNTSATLNAGNYALANVFGSDALTVNTTSGTYDDRNVASGKTVTVNGLTFSGATAANYILTSTTATGAVGDITPRPLTISATGINKNYDATTAATVNLSDNRVAGDTLTTNYTNAAFADATAGVAKPVFVSGITLAGTDAGNYSFNTTTTTTANINRLLVTITANNQSVVYGTPVPGGTASYSGFIAGEDETFLTTLPTINSARSGIQNVGTYAGNYTASGALSDNYNFAYVAGDLTVTRRNLNVSVNNQTVTYGVAVPGGTLTYSGFITGEDASFLTTQPTVSSARSGIQPVGTYSGNYTAAGGVSGNYTFIYSPGDLIVTRANLNVSANNKSVNYGTAVPTGTLSYSGFIPGEDASFLTTQPTVSSGLSGIQNAGTYTGNYTASGGVADNYNFIYTPGTFTVTPTGLNVTVQNRSVTYGTAVPASVIVYTGFVLGEDESFLTVQPSISSGLSGIVNAGTYTGNYTASGGVASNYSFNYVPGDLTVSPRPLNVSVANRSITYGTVVPTSTLSYSGFIPGEDASFLTVQPSISSGVSGIQNAGIYAGNYTASGGVSNNYTFNYTAGDLNISRAPLTISAGTRNVIYGASVPTSSISYGGFVNGESAADLLTQPTISSGLSGIQPVGSYVANYTVGGAASLNYSFTYVPGDFNVSRRNLTVTANSQSITYGTAVPVTGVSYSGFIPGEDASFLTTQPTASAGVSGIVDAGLYNGTYVAAGGVADNYSFTYVPGDLSVARAPLSIRANDVARIFGSGNLLGGQTITGLQNGESVGGVTLTTNAPFSGSGNWRAGNWTITPSAASGGSFNPSNYTITYSNGALAISPRALLVGATGIDKIYDGSTSASVTLNNNRLSGDVFGISANSFFSDRNAGTGRIVSVNAITLSGADAANYVANNTTTTIANILARGLTVTAQGIDKPFDGNVLATVTLRDNRVSGDNLTVSYLNALFASAGVASTVPITVDGIAISGVDAGNYTLLNNIALTSANILSSPASQRLPNTVVKVSQDTGNALQPISDDGVYATPATSYLLIYLPSDAPPSSRLENRPPVIHQNTHQESALLQLPDDEKRLRKQRKQRPPTLLADRPRFEYRPASFHRGLLRREVSI